MKQILFRSSAPGMADCGEARPLNAFVSKITAENASFKNHLSRFTSSNSNHNNRIFDLTQIRDQLKRSTSNSANESQKNEWSTDYISFQVPSHVDNSQTFEVAFNGASPAAKSSSRNSQWINDFYGEYSKNSSSSHSSFMPKRIFVGRPFIPTLHVQPQLPLMDLNKYENHHSIDEQEAAALATSILVTVDGNDPRVKESEFFKYMKCLSESEKSKFESIWEPEHISSTQFPPEKILSELSKGRQPSEICAFQEWKTQYLNNIDQLVEDDSEWNNLEKDWEIYNATGSGYSGWGYENLAKKPYVFVAPHDNPYWGNSAAYELGLKFLNEGRPSQAVLAFESAIKSNEALDSGYQAAILWSLLGQAQAQNEKDNQAISALTQSVNLDNSILDSWLSLSVSYTNESCLPEAYDSLLKWIENHPNYSQKLDFSPNAKWKTVNPAQRTSSRRPVENRHWQLVNLFIDAARLSPQNLDENVQVALAILFNIAQDYEKAIDCLNAALEKRPKDATLWNRLGATLANNGQYESAIVAYSKALLILPEFVRSRYNLAISYMNLGSYSKAIQELLQALKLQQISNNCQLENQSMIRNTGMWDTLRIVCDMMERPDLADAALSLDFIPFQKEFEY